MGRGGGGDSRAASLKVLMILLDAFAVYVNSAGGEEDAKAGHAAATAPLIASMLLVIVAVPINAGQCRSIKW